MAYKYMPVSLSLVDQPCLVVGGGTVALRKIETMMDYGGQVTVIAPEVDDKIKYFGESGKIRLEQREYQKGEAARYMYVISASDDMELNRQVSDDCRAGGALVNVVDAPSLCDFIFPAVVRRDSLTAAISTDGQAPFMSGHLRTILEDVFPPHWNKLMPVAARFRKMVQERWPEEMHMRTVSFAQFLEADWKALLKEKDKDVLEEALIDMLKPREEKPEGQPPIPED